MEWYKNESKHPEKIRALIEEGCLILGINTAHDFEGVESEEDEILYLKVIIERAKEWREELKKIENEKKQRKILQA